MKNKKITRISFFCLIIISLFFTSPILFAQSIPEGAPVGEEFCACPGISKPLGNASNCEVACYGEQNSKPSLNYEAQQQVQEAAAVNQRIREKEIEHEAEVKRKKAADFISDRDATAKKLKGSLGNETQLKGLPNSQISELKATKPELKKKLKQTPLYDSASVKKTIKALDCAVKTILKEIQNVDSTSVQADLNAVKNIIGIPPTGKYNTYQIQNISFNHQISTNGKEKQIVGSIQVSRNEENGEVHIDVMQATTKDTGFFSRIFGKKTSTQKSQSLLTIDRNGDILDNEVPRSVRKCLKEK